ncbi:response regulator [Maribacter sp. 2307ULW6-5]|uniref:response regulator n=1 Tax=Maribacter sp. 2307ULW6-5 TaxID=3386275 RepID=UPI0039BC8ACE
MALTQMNIALADDDADDRLFFKDAIAELDIKTKLSLFINGQELMDYLLLPNIVLPEIVFLDLNMPIKDGMQCLREIRANERIKDLCVAIYSTSSSERDIEQTFVNGANIYINKPTTFGALKKAVDKVLRLNWQYHTSSLNRDTFLLRI